MKLLDVNILLYAHNSSFPEHQRAREWLELTLSGTEAVGLAWVTVLAFLRVSTSPRAFPAPFSVEEARSIVSDWLEHPSVSILEPGEGHWSILAPLLVDAQARGDLVTDAHLAALAIEHGATVCTNDRDFARFQKVQTLNPLGS